MGFLDKVKDTASKAAEKVQQAAETGQEKLEEQKTKKKVGDLKEALGSIVYAQRTGAAPENAEADITRIVQEIQAAEVQLAAAADESSSSSVATDGPAATDPTA
ncbi:MAG: hypothetical protein FJW88_02395 [Actinobacteria bacterium]|nr:hypothetical protein [Actinomycetota bacterium]